MKGRIGIVTVGAALVTSSPAFAKDAAVDMPSQTIIDTVDAPDAADAPDGDAPDAADGTISGKDK